VLVVLGPTGVGKTGLGVELADRFGGEVVSQDSRQVYRLMDIGTAKPSAEERARAPHHALDLVWPPETWTLAQQQRLTYDLVARLSGEGRLPLLVGGTGQYLRAALEGWTIPQVPPDEGLRDRLRARAEAEGTGALHRRLREVDAPAAERIMPNDLRRIVRALEVWERTGRPLSEQQRAEPPPWDALVLGLTLPRERLYERLDARAEAQVGAGLLDEIRGLLARGYGWELPSMRSVGYGEFRPHFEGGASLGECIQRLKWDTHALARRQYVWFRRFEAARWFDVSTPGARGEIEAAVQRWLTA
jgi:tRNA dimethylallyltransferase